MNNKTSYQYQAKSRPSKSLQLLLWVLILFSINFIGYRYYFRLDLTEEKRYTIAPSTVQFLDTLDDELMFHVYLDGDLPPGFRKLQNAIKELLDEFKIRGKENIVYQFVDPSESHDKKTRNAFYQQLADKGLQPTNLEERNKDGSSQKIIFPGVIITYKGKETAVSLLKNKIGAAPEESINSSIESLEYELMNAIRQFNYGLKPSIGFLQGHGELPTKNLYDIANALSGYYTVDSVAINGQLNSLDGFQLLIIPKPTLPFSEKDKFILDQYIMHGGKVIFLVEQMVINMDSLMNASSVIAVAENLNLQDMLFKYGVRINDDLVLDLQAAPIPIVTGYSANQPQQSLFPWYYFPLATAAGDHPIVKNINPVKMEFASSIDFVDNDQLKKTVLLSTSTYSSNMQSPARVSLNILKENPDPNQFRKRNQALAILLEGEFHSVFKNRIPTEIRENKSIDFKELSKPSQIIVIGDGDLISNFVSRKGAYYPLGFDRYTNQTYGNKTFFLNAVDYMLGYTNILELRNKEYKIRLLDSRKAESKPLQYAGVLAPLVLVLIFAIIFQQARKKRFSR